MDFDLNLLLSVIGGLGNRQEQPDGSQVYVRDDDCIACLKDIQRFLRNDDAQSRDTFFTLGEFDLARQHLMPLITTYPDDVDVVFNALKVATWMTMPIEPGSDKPALQQQNMQSVREAVVAGDTLKAIVDLVTIPLAHHPRMSEQEASIIQLVVCFVRNLLCIPDARATDGSRGDHRSRLRGEFIFRLESDHLLDLFIMFASESDQNPFAKDVPLLVEVFQLIFKDVHPAAVLAAKYAQPKAAKAVQVKAKRRAPIAARTGQPQAAATIAAEEAAMQQEQRDRRRRMERKRAEALRSAQARVPRHSRFGATYVHRDSSGKQTGQVSAPVAPGRTGALAHTSVKGPVSGTAFKLKPLPSQALQPAGTAGRPLLTLLAKYTERFLGKPYDNLMGNLRKDLDAGLGISRLPRSAFIHYMQLAGFCTTYVRLKQERFLALPADKQRTEFQAEQLGSSEGEDSPSLPKVLLQLSPFTVVQASMGWDTFHMVHKTWLDAINTPPSSHEKDWDMQHVATAFLRQFLALVDLAADSNLRQDRQSSDRLQRRMLHDDMKESGLLPVLAKLVKDFSARRSSRVYAADLVAALHSTMRLLTRLSLSEKGGFLVKRRCGGGGGQGQRKQAPADGPPTSDVDPTADAGADTTGPSTRTDDGTDGSATAANEAVPEEEGADEPAWDHGEEDDNEEEGSEGGNAINGNRTRHDPFEEDDQEERRQQATREVAYDLKKRLVQELAYPNVVHFYVWLLSGYQHNEAATNHEVISFLQRICHPTRGLDMEPMLYQIAILRIFGDILDNRDLVRAPAGLEMSRFMRTVLRNMFARLMPPLPPDSAADFDAQASPGDASMAPQFGTVWPSGDPREEADNAADTAAAAKEAQEAQEAMQQEAKAKQACGQLLFLELLFWKNAKISSEIRDEYNWRDEGLDGSNGGVPIFTPAQDDVLRQAWEEVGSRPGAVDAVTAQLAESGYRMPRTAVAARLNSLGLKRGWLTEAQDRQIKELWEKYSGEKAAAASIAEDMNIRKSIVAKRLRAFGLKHGTLTDAQEAELRAAHAKHNCDRGALAVIAASMEWRFTKGQISKHLRKMNLSIQRNKIVSNANDGSNESSEGSSAADMSPDSDSSGSDSDVLPLTVGKPAKKKRKQSTASAKSGGRPPLREIMSDSSDSNSSASGSGSPADRPSSGAQQSGLSDETAGERRTASTAQPAAPSSMVGDTQQAAQQGGPSANGNECGGADMELSSEEDDVENVREPGGNLQAQFKASRHEDGQLRRRFAVASSARSELEELKAARRHNIVNAAAARAATGAPLPSSPPRTTTPSSPDSPAVSVPIESSPHRENGSSAGTAAIKTRRLMRKTEPAPEQAATILMDELDDF